MWIFTMDGGLVRKKNYLEASDSQNIADVEYEFHWIWLLFCWDLLKDLAARLS